ncbi:hypothetical protein ACNOYE_16860 [Nannocystaceae bacterium ST9]
MTVHLVASCTERKRVAVPDDLCLGSLGSEPSADAWLTRLNSIDVAGVQARDLYGGEHWRLVLDLEEQLSREHDVRLWVASAGYGLMPADAELRPYSATFTPNTRDSVAQDANPDLLRPWWKSLCKAHGHTLEDLAREATALVVIASSKYVRAMSEDLECALAELPDDGLVLFSGAGSVEEALAPSLVKVDARVQVALGGPDSLRGTKQGLAARTAQTLLAASNWPPRASPIKAAYNRLVTDHEPPAVPQRERHDDQAVLEFIEAQLREDPRLGWTPLLRRWRASGQACEQKRFRGLFRSVKDKTS